MQTIHPDFEGAVEGDVITKTIPDLRATVEKQEPHKWYVYDIEHYNQWFTMSKANTRHPYDIHVRQRQRRVYVKKVPVSPEPVGAAA